VADTDGLASFVEITKKEQPTTPTFTTGIDEEGISICEQLPYDVTASSANSTSIEWSVDGAGNGKGISPLATTGNVSVGTHYYKAIAQKDGCPSEEAEIVITVQKSAEITLAPSKIVSCQNDLVAFTAEATDVVPAEYRWFLDGEEIHQTAEGNMSFNLQSSTIVKVVIDNNLACGGEAEDEQAIEVLGIFTPLLNTIDTIGCKEDGAILLTVKDQSGLSATPVYVWERNGELLNNNTANLSVTKSGEYRVVMSNGICPSEDRADQTIADVVIQDLSVELITSATDVEKETEVILTAVVDNEIGSITYEWAGEDEGIIGVTNSNEYVYIVDTSDVMYVMITDLQTGCTAESNHELVNVLSPVDVPNAFTPNGDGINDTWTIEGLNTYRNAVLKVYNRWGQVVYTHSGTYNNDWDGTRKGKDLPVGTYYYVITLNQDGRENVSGDISIIR